MSYVHYLKRITHKREILRNVLFFELSALFDGIYRYTTRNDQKSLSSYYTKDVDNIFSDDPSDRHVPTCADLFLARLVLETQ